MSSEQLATEETALTKNIQRVLIFLDAGILVRPDWAAL